jgi:ribose/xylose/arabinose/galactoside ABC-type transport system permease subunit
VSTDAPTTALLRGSAVGAVSTALAIAAHGLAGGDVPPASALTLLIAVCSAVGAITGTLPVPTRGPLPLIAALGAGQLAAHTTMTLSVHSHSPSPGLAMLGAHIVATLVCATLVLAAERLFGVVTRVVQVVLSAPAMPVAALIRRFPTTHHLGPNGALLRAGISPRGPPALV